MVAGAGVVAGVLPHLQGRGLIHADALALVLKPSVEVTGFLARPRAPGRVKRIMFVFLKGDNYRVTMVFTDYRVFKQISHLLGWIDFDL